MSDFPLNAEPFRIEPIFSERLWGARSLAPFFPEMHDLKSPIGEAWLTSVDCRVANGPFAGHLLGEAWKSMTRVWRGSKFEDESVFPLLVKFIFPTDKLSIQVHPDDAYAGKHEVSAGGRGKTEMWHVVSAEPGARLLAGLKPGVTRERFVAALADHTLEDLFQSYDVRAGDTFFLPAGTPHTIGPNMVICEVQEYSDLTYRLYDYDRVEASGKPRELHVEKALEVMNFDARALAKVESQPYFMPGAKFSEKLIDCAYFSAVKSEYHQSIHMNAMPVDPQRFSLWVFLEGEGTISWQCSPHDTCRASAGTFSYKQGECWFAPASFGSRGYHPKTKTNVLVASPLNPKLDVIASTDRWRQESPSKTHDE